MNSAHISFNDYKPFISASLKIHSRNIRNSLGVEENEDRFKHGISEALLTIQYSVRIPDLKVLIATLILDAYPFCHKRGLAHLLQTALQSWHNHFGEEALPQSVQIQNRLGQTLTVNNNWQESLTHHHSALLKATESQNGELVAQTKFLLSEAYRMGNQLEDAYQYAISAHQYFIGADNTSSWYASTSNTVGLVLEQMNELSQSTAYFEQAIAAHSDEIEIGRSTSNYGNVLRKQGEFDRALTLFNQALQLFKKNIVEQAITYSHIGCLWADQNQYEPAIDFFKKALALLEEKSQHSARKIQLYGNLGYCYGQLGQYDKATEALHSGLDMSNFNNNVAGLKRIKGLLKDLKSDTLKDDE